MSQHPYRLAVVAAFAVALFPVAAARAQARTVDESEHTAEALIAITNHWSDAEAQGDTAYLNRLLAPEYRSVNVDGTSYPKERIVAGALRRGSPAAVTELARWRKEHHHGTSVVIDDATAVVTYYNPELGAQRGITSADVLVYRSNHWQALYSSHTAAKQG